MPDAEALAAEAAERFIQLSQEGIAARGRFTVALSGGSTPAKLYACLAEPAQRDRVSWDQTFFFTGDERFVPQDDERSNFGLARRALLEPIGVPESNWFPMPTPPLATDLADAAHRYMDTLATFFQAPRLDAPPVFDLILLGLGDDGHTASLFPGMPALEAQAVWVTGTPPGTLPPPVPRLTLTFPILNCARSTLFLVAGAGKADALQATLKAGALPKTHPAAGIRPANGTLTFLLDQAAAARL
ncbi:MAG: 6-phosphogluconolactonase [Cytophagales bacterium]|nr:6-phosphogluconolactonase [Armatimonadota bacterium]